MWYRKSRTSDSCQNHPTIAVCRGSRRITMPAREVRDYLLRRESECREMAARATAPSVRKIHESLADRFAARAEAMKEEAA